MHCPIMANIHYRATKIKYQVKQHYGEIILISYENLWKTMKEKGITQYSLIKKYHVSTGQLSRLRSNSYVSTHTIDMLCDILDCDVEDIMTHIRDSSNRNKS
jgi:DNA-binding Xre family transcriptional regulator